MAERADLRVDLRAELRSDLRADCSRCVGLCCVAPAFTVSADFAIDKPAGQACPHLTAQSTCGIHNRLRPTGFAGCAVFDCFGAGQHVTQLTFGGGDWRGSPAQAASMFTAFSSMRQLKEVLWYLAEASTLVPAGALRDELDGVRQRTERLTFGSPEELAGFDGAAYRQQVGALLRQVSEVVRASVARHPPGPPGEALAGADLAGADLAGADLAGADLMGADLRKADLRGGSLRGAYLIGADLRGADLHRADLLGADLRSADLRGAALATSLFLTQPQLEAANGDEATAIPPWATRPAHWTG